MSLAQEMWGYLKSIGFEDIPKNDERLGDQCGDWDLTIAKGSLVAHQDIETMKTDSWIFLINATKSDCALSTDYSLNIHSVSDLEAWLRKEYPEFFTVEKSAIKQHQYKVGDKVRILEDAIDGKGTVCYSVT